MKELLTYIVQSLVDNPDQVSVTERKADGETVFEVRVADGDMGKVIGRHICSHRRRAGLGVCRASLGHRRCTAGAIFLFLEERLWLG